MERQWPWRSMTSMTGKVSRREFLIYGAIFLCTVSGVTGAFLYFSNLFVPSVEHGFGAKAFGAGAYGR
jgi:hypothetical protein